MSTGKDGISLKSNGPSHSNIRLGEQSDNSLTRELAFRRKTVVEKFFLTPKPVYRKSTKYDLYQKITFERATELYAEAKKAFDDGSYEKCLLFLHKALVMDPDNVSFYILCGEAYLQLCDFKSAICNYKKVCMLRPGDDELYSKLALIYFIQGQCYYDEEMYLDALECFTRAAEMKPENKSYHSRSIACLASLNRHKECLLLVNERLNVEPTNPDLFILRARINLLFNNSTLSYFDVKQALSLDPESHQANSLQKTLESNAQACRDRAIELDMKGKTKEAIAKMSQAIDISPEETEFHLLRAGMHRHNSDFNASVDDLLLTMNKCCLDKDNELYERAQQQLLLTFNDFAVDCFKKGFYEEAVILLEKAIKGEKTNSSLYCNRGGFIVYLSVRGKSSEQKYIFSFLIHKRVATDCFYKLGHLHFALLDYQQAEELSPSDRSISLRLSIVYNELGVLQYTDRKYYLAEDYFSLAISYDPTVGAYYLSRSKSRYMQEKIVEAKVDIISALHLEPQSKEAISTCSRLFYGKSLEQILNDDFGSLVIEALQCVLQEKEEEYLCEVPQSSLTGIDKIKSYGTSPKECFKECMGDKEFRHKVIKGKKMVDELMESVIQSRQELPSTK